MAIYTSEELVNAAPAANLPEALAKGVVNGICRGAPILAGYGLLTGNLPALAFGTAGSIACGLPLFPVEPQLPPGWIPFPGGQCDILYRLDIEFLNHNEDCSVANNSTRVDIVRGPISQFEDFVRDVKYACRSTPLPLLSGGYVDGLGNRVVVANFSPVLGGFVRITPTPQGSAPDNCGNQAPFPTDLPPGVQIPPGWPETPYLPGQVGVVPFLLPDSPPGTPPRFVPWRFPDIPLIIPIAPSLTVPIDAPISIPISVDLPVDFGFAPSLTVQLDSEGNLRTEPDLLCPCEKEKKPVIPPPRPTTQILLPYYACGQNKGFKEVPLEVISSSIPSGLLDVFLSSANLAELGCESLGAEQEQPSLLERSRTGDVLVPAYYSNLLDEKIVSVELRIVEFSRNQHRELTTFPGGNQRKFGSIAYCIEGVDGGSDPTWIWDTRTYMRLPERMKPGRLKILLREGITFELWDTGERR